jgi:valyl-tRNA synthetase
MLTKFLSRVPAIADTNGSPRGLRLAIANHELYIDAPTDVIREYKEGLEKRILSVGAELDGLNRRMMNPQYVERAPQALVKETRNAIAEKEALIQHLKDQISVIE